MSIDLKKISLMRRRRGERMENTPLWPTRDDFAFLGRFFARHRSLLIKAVSFLAAQGFLEVVLILLSHRYLKNGGEIYGLMSNSRVFIFIAVGSIIYLVASYFAIKLERTLVIKLINNLRSKWFQLSLNQNLEQASLDNKGVLLAKISYHLPLLAMGFTNSLAGSLRWLLYSIILLFLCFVFSTHLVIFFIVGLIINVGIGLAGYYVSRYYVSRETTFYSKIIKLVDFTLSDWQFTKNFHRERATLNDFNNLVDIDSYFRVRRDIWLRFGASIVFILIIFFGWIFSVYNQEISTFISTTDSNDKFSLVIFTVYFSRLLYESLRIGLYSVPFTFGLSLAVPKVSPPIIGKDYRPKFKEIIFKSSKVKLFKKSRYYKDLKFIFNIGRQYLITGARRSGKTSLANLFCGHGEYGRRAWIIKVKDCRYFYNDFFGKYASFYFIDPKFKSERTLLEVVAGREKSRISQEDFAKISTLVNSHEELKEIFFEKEDWRLKAHKFTKNPKNNLLLQVAYCLVNKPYFIAVDNYWSDLHDGTCDVLLKLLADNLPTSIVVFFAAEDSGKINFSERYEI
ncbi:MAG: hypothetical protein WCN88_05335 [Candidatus Falkowbacteria bacterium]